MHDGTTRSPLTPYQKRLFVFLSVATFFEGYDFLALTQILPNLRADMGLSKGDLGWLVGWINLGTIVAYLLVRSADRFGRRRLLTVTILGYTVFTFLTGLAPNVWLFGIAQFLARVFLVAEWAVSTVIAAEEFPADRRGTVIGIIGAVSTLGSIVCAGVVPLLLATSYGWRSVYFVGILPLLLLAFARRNLEETRRFAEQGGRRRSLFAIWQTPYRRRLLQMSLIWGLTYVCNQTAVTFWKDFAVTERGMSDGAVGQSIVVASLFSMPMVFLAGPLLDALGRRVGALVIFGLGALGTFFAYTFESQWALTVPLIFGVFGIAAAMPVLNAYTTELFPTEYRADAFAWSNNVLGRIGYVLSPLAVGLAAERIGWSDAVRLTTLSPILAVILIWLWLPETGNRELEETSRLG